MTHVLRLEKCYFSISSPVTRKKQRRINIDDIDGVVVNGFALAGGFDREEQLTS